MQPEYHPGTAVLELLARADALAAAVGAAVAAGDDDALLAVLDERESVVAAAVAASRAVDDPSPAFHAALTAAARESVTLGQAARNMVALAREQVATELAALDARQQASHEYQSATAQATIDVTL